MKILMKVLLVGTLMIAAITLAAAQAPTVTAQPNTVFAGGDGKFESAPDTAVLNFNISAQESTSAAAYDRASKYTEQVRQILRNNGIDPKSAEISSYSINPLYDYKDPKRKLIGYQVSASVSLKLKDFTDELEHAEDVLCTLGRSVEARDPYTEGHCERLAQYGAELGRYLGLNEEQQLALHRGG